jgi:hypothetical protein
VANNAALRLQLPALIFEISNHALGCSDERGSLP